ncbi:2Fe-2S iron-sulfur cluster binding domain-containing protein [Nocardioides glacieisoli]|uniref:2Fe-2S iron-sulfur cluster binding domain-containing protein n=1 Tax=Nocardioides glacieisoli TaxID=1168730 RepID=A0A4Q2RU12_9ACTN|nr:FAD binding domain-containing protein [Nocardioides glacieisoli]RYB91309.1 2Fe-2S iron-sulfur cluster binding domain-containing protein [Nocardioides glacieisoli]
MTEPHITVNGRPRALGATPAHTNALDFLRGLGLTGAKEGCAEGECGACAVMVARPDGEGSRWTPVNACLVPAAALDGQEVVTAEGLGSPDDLHPVQAELAERGGSQCGYCTPGFVCSMAAEYYRPGREDFDLHAIGGNLCRCTGYRPIRDAAAALGPAPADDPFAERCMHAAPASVPTRLDDFARPADLHDALALLAEHPDATVVAGSTDWGVEVNLRGRRASYVVAVDRLPELRQLVVGDEIEIGAALTLSEVEAGLGGSVPLLDRVWPLFASRLIRNGATIGGNLGTASPIGDLAPALLALDARLVLASADGYREVALADYFTGYRESVKRPDELIRSVRIPTPLASHTTFRKISKRRLDDISSVAVAAALDVVDGTVARARIGLGGVAATPIRALATEAALEGRPWTLDTVEEAAAVMAGEGTPIDDQRASAAYRSAMLGNALRAWWSEGSQEGESR